MINKELEKKEKPKELVRAEIFIDEGKHDEALQLIKDFEEKEVHTLYEIVSCNLLKCKLFFQQGLYQDVIKLAELAYKESLGLGESFLSIDALFIMTETLISFSELEKAFDIIKKGEELIKELPQESTKAYKQRKAYLAFIKGFFYIRRYNPNDSDLSLMYLEHSLGMREELGIKHEIAESLGQIAYSLTFYKGELNRALKYAERSVALAKESNKKYYIARNLNILGMIYYFQGDIVRSIRICEQSLELFKELNNKRKMAGCFNNLSGNYQMRGELDRALECIEQAMVLNRELRALRYLANNYDFLIEILIDKGDLERAEISLRDLEQIRDQLKDNVTNLMYLYNRAWVLKASPKAHNRDEAEEILIRLLENEDLSYEITVRSLLNLCELLLIKLSNTSDLKVLDKIQDYVNQILNAAKNSHSYWLLAETHLLRAKLKLIMFEFEETQQLLTQAAHIAEKYNQNLLIKQISAEQEELSKKLNKWKELKQSKAKITNRIELAGLEKQIRRLLKKRMSLGKS